MNYKFMLQKNKYRFSYRKKMLLVNEVNISNRRKEISLYIKELALYKISLKRLCQSSPEEEVKNLLLNMAYAIINEDKIYKEIKTTRTLPTKSLAKFTHESSLFIEKWQDYLLAYILLLSNNTYVNIQSYLNIEYSEENFYKSTDPFNPSNESLSKTQTGLVLKTNNNTSFIITSYGVFKTVKVDNSEYPQVDLGDLVTGNTKKGFKIYKLPILISIFSLILLASIGFAIYSQPYINVVVEVNGSMKIQLNRLNRVISYSASNSTTKKILTDVQIKNKNVDNTLYSILKYGTEKEVIKKGTVVYVYINGANFDDSNLENSQEFIVENKLDVRINNNGIEHKLNK